MKPKRTVKKRDFGRLYFSQLKKAGLLNKGATTLGFFGGGPRLPAKFFTRYLCEYEIDWLNPDEKLCRWRLRYG